MRDLAEQPAKVSEHRLRTGAQQHLPLLRDYVKADRSQRRRILNPEPDTGRYHPLAAQRSADRIRPEAGGGIAEAGPAHLRRIGPAGQPGLRRLLIARRRGSLARIFVKPQLRAIARIGTSRPQATADHRPFVYL